MDALKSYPEIYTKLLYNVATLKFISGNEYSALIHYQNFIHYIEKNHPEQLTLSPDETKYWQTLWVTTWLHLKDNQKEPATSLFKKMLTASNSSYKVASAYWLSKFGKGEKNIVESYPFSYYFSLIKDKVPHLNAGKERFIKLISGETGKHFSKLTQDMKTLLKYGFYQECLLLIKEAIHSMPLNQTEKNLFKIIESIIHLKRKNYAMAFITFRNNFKEYQALILPQFLSEICFPYPKQYISLIETYSKKYGVDPFLVMALIRNESFFRPRVVSPSKAYGLMQIVYKTARLMARQNRMRIRRRSLFNPTINIRLGISYLKFLLKKYNNQIYLALAAYNAGDHRVNAWLTQFGTVSEEEFIEMIPFTETRNYVKKLIRNKFFYEYYYQ